MACLVASYYVSFCLCVCVCTEPSKNLKVHTELAHLRGRGNNTQGVLTLTSYSNFHEVASYNIIIEDPKLLLKCHCKYPAVSSNNG